MPMTRAVLITLALSLSGCSCETVMSKDVRTSGLYANLTADAPGDGQVFVKATLALGAGSLTSLELSEGDALLATVGSTARAMSRRSLFNATWYEASFDGDAAGTLVKVSFSRQIDTSAPESVIHLPTPFTFTAPTAGQSFPRTAGLTVTWSNSGQGDPLRLRANGTCIQSVDLELTTDPGSQALVAFQPSSGNEAKSCEVSLKMVRRRTGGVDPAYGKGGTFEATATRTLTITSTP